MFRAFYDLAVALPSYDVISFLCAAEAQRLASGLQEMEIVIVPGPREGFRPEKLWPESTAERIAMLDNVVIPICRLLPSVAAIEKATGRPKGGFGVGLPPMFGLRLQVEAMRAGIRPLRPKTEAPKQSRLVTITLRECDHWQSRNSRVVEWLNAARIIESMGFEVVFVRDTARVYNPLDGARTDARAARFITARAQLYRSAGCNMFVSNGPAYLALHLDAPTMIFRPAAAGAGRCAAPEFWANHGMPPGSQFPGSPEYQRLIWREDLCDNIVSSFRQFQEARACKAES